MKSLLSVFSLFVFLVTNVKAMPSGEEQSTSNYGYKSIPTVRYELTNPNLSILQIKDWCLFFFQNKICWWKIDLRGSSYKNLQLYKPLHLRYDMQPSDIEEALRNSFHPQDLKQQKGTILILD